MKYKQIWKTAAACLMAAVMLPGCSDEEGGGTTNPEDKYRTLVVSINSRSNAEPVGTRALEGPTELPTSTDEDAAHERKIDQYWLIMLKESDTDANTFYVDKVITQGDDEYRTPGTDEDSNTSLEVEVEIGKTYRFYALANLASLTNGNTLIEQIEALDDKENTTFSPETLQAQVMAVANYENDGDGKSIPMSSYCYQQKIDDTNELKEKIALIRLIGKVTLEIRNKTGQDITLKSLKMGKFRTGGDIYLFPWDVENIESPTRLLLKEIGSTLTEGDIPNFPESSTEEVDHDDATFVSSDVTIPQYDETDNTQKRYFTQYVDETYQGQELMITAVTNPARDDTDKPSGFSFVRRNDWLQIPVQITNVTTDMSIEQKHMPIGGLPDNLTFGEVTVPIAWCRTTHGGDITVNFALKGVSGMTGAQLSFYSSGGYEGGTERFTSAILKSNQEDILINTPSGNGAAPWLELDENESAIHVTAGQPDASLGILGQGSFTVTAQELAASTEGLAEIELRMVITDGTQYMTIPYTVYITNKTTN